MFASGIIPVRDWLRRRVQDEHFTDSRPHVTWLGKTGNTIRFQAGGDGQKRCGGGTLRRQKSHHLRRLLGTRRPATAHRANDRRLASAVGRLEVGAVSQAKGGGGQVGGVGGPVQGGVAERVNVCDGGRIDPVDQVKEVVPLAAKSQHRGVACNGVVSGGRRRVKNEGKVACVRVCVCVCVCVCVESDCL